MAGSSGMADALSSKRWDMHSSLDLLNLKQCRSGHQRFLGSHQKYQVSELATSECCPLPAKEFKFRPLVPYNEKNTTISEDCLMCQSTVAEKNRLESRSQEPNPAFVEDENRPEGNNAADENTTPSRRSDVHSYACKIYTHCKLTFGGDWEWLARLLGLSGPNGKYFCPCCLSTLSQLSNGIPQGLHILPKYQSYLSTSHVASSEIPLRSFEQCHKEADLFQISGSNLKDASLHFNCISPPLIGNYGNINEVLSTMPLHVSLGQGLHNFNIVEKIAIDLDNHVKSCDGIYNESVSSYISERNRLIDVQCELGERIKKANDTIESKQANIDLFKQENEFSFRKVNNRVVDNSEQAKVNRKHA
ncbi:uncharacterized protein [Ptychodera flava]|uniref:uncharacterized protein n=1 Tax=Ptychodera flava TaxID=63121 RepID=UPI00396A8CB8